MTDDLEERVETLHEHLAATAELPVERTASHWIGEAEAVAGDLVHADANRGVVRERIGHVRSLLANVEETGHPAADDHVTRAKRIATEVLDDVDGE